jgi:hypothetical protein
VQEDVDIAIGHLLLQEVTPMAVEVALTVAAELTPARADEADTLRRQQVQRARQRVELARRRYLAVDPDNRLVADTLEADWNDALRAPVRQRDARRPRTGRPVERRPHPSDRRTQQIFLTAAGRQRLAEAVPTVQAVEARLAAGFTADEIAVVNAWLQRMTGAAAPGDEIPTL